MALISDTEQSFIAGLLDQPHDALLRLVFADWLEEHGDDRAELLRLTQTLTRSSDIPNRADLEARLRTLLEQGVQPVGPFWTNDLGMKFAWIPPGTFLMGSPEEEEGRRDNETYHKVTLTKGFYMGVHAVTQERWQAIMGNNPSGYTNEKNLPVDNVSWEDCQEFIKKLRDKDKKTYRLPSEAEWEYACRAGTTTPFHFGETISTNQVHYHGKYTYGTGKKGAFRLKTTPVGSFPANAWGLFDMHGNVQEWCQDCYGIYPQNELIDPPGPTTGRRKVLRGGSWSSHPLRCRSAYRIRYELGHRSSSHFGFRVCFCLD